MHKTLDILAIFAILITSEGDTDMITNAKKTMTLNLTEAEMKALDDLSAKKDLSKTAVLRQALRLYQMIEHRLSLGEKLYFEHELSKQKAELMVL